MSDNKKPSKQNFYPRIWLAISGGIIIIISAQLSHYRFISQTDIYNYLIPVGIGVLLILPLIFYFLRSK